jgi:hypothetical protein
MTIMRVLQKRRKNPMCVLNPHVGIAIEEEKSSVGFETPCRYWKRGKNPTCVLRPKAGIAIEEK